MKFTGIKETCIYIKDLDVAKSFYHDKLGLEIITELEGKHIFFRAGNSVLLCFNPEDSKSKQSPPPHYTYGPQHFAFEVNKQDYEASKEWIKKMEIMILEEVQWKSGLESFYFEDPAGNVLEILPSGVWD